MLRGKRDANGKLLMDYSNGKHVFEIIERNDGLIEVGGGPRVYFSAYDSWRPHVQEAVSHANGRILDIGCGAGRFSLYLQEKGLDVVGIDNSELTVDVYKARGLKNILPVGIDEIDSSLGIFDTILMLGNGFGLMQSFDNARRILNQFNEITSDNAQIISESINPNGTDVDHDLQYFEMNRKNGRMPGQIRMRIRYLDYKTPYFDFLLASPDEIKTIIEGTVWKLDKTFGDVNNGFIALIKKI